MDILSEICNTAAKHPDRTAVTNGSQSCTYEELWRYSGILACVLHERIPKGQPVPVYGHKSPWMPVCFLACVRSGHPYCPVDTSVPTDRVRRILQLIPAGTLLMTEDAPHPDPEGGHCLLSLEELRRICGAVETTEPGSGREEAADAIPDPSWAVAGGDIFYIIFTSGSTGIPKGVQISAECLFHFLDWSVGLGGMSEAKRGAVFLNQAPFSFDLSVMDLYTCFALGGTLYCLEKRVQADYRLLMQALKDADPGVWVSTPSFAELCLAEPGFDSGLLGGLSVFLFCGERLTNRTARRLARAFPAAAIINTYGPTESTVAVTDITVTPDLCDAEDPLPVGRPKPGTRILIRDESGRELPEGSTGEIVILGDTVSPGYYGREDLTRKAFFTVSEPFPCRGYRTGDAGYMKDGILYFNGRIDLQVKYHGYRIELEDIEQNLCRLPQVEQAVVIPSVRAGKVSGLDAWVVAAGAFEEASVKEELRKLLPDYMVPRHIRPIERIPMTPNGKADRKALEGYRP